MEATKELTDAADLLVMLEVLTEGLSQDMSGSATPPWAGIKLILRQSREAVLSAHEKVSRGNHSVVNYNEPVSQQRHDNFSTGSLADRVQQIPPAGASRARDLLNNVTSAGKVTRVQAPMPQKAVANDSNEL